jgi:hypothetical protein
LAFFYRFISFYIGASMMRDALFNLLKSSGLNPSLTAQDEDGYSYKITFKNEICEGKLYGTDEHGITYILANDIESPRGDVVIKLKDAAKQLTLAMPTFRRLIDVGKIKTINPSPGRRAVLQSAIDAYVESLK